MRSVVVYDCEFLTAPGAPMRFWCGPRDPDPLCVQIGAVILSLVPPFEISGPVGWHVQPVDRDGAVVPVDPLLARLTGITDAILRDDGLPLAEALDALDGYAEGGMLISWGKDDLLTLAASLFVQGVASPIAAHRFRNATPLLLAAGETAETIHGLRSNTICAHYGIDAPGPAHDARSDAQSVALALRHLLETGRIAPSDVAGLAPARND